MLRCKNHPQDHQNHPKGGPGNPVCGSGGPGGGSGGPGGGSTASSTTASSTTASSGIIIRISLCWNFKRLKMGSTHLRSGPY